MSGLSNSEGNTPVGSPLLHLGGQLRTNNWASMNGTGRIKRSQTLSGTYELSEDLQAKQVNTVHCCFNHLRIVSIWKMFHTHFSDNGNIVAVIFMSYAS